MTQSPVLLGRALPSTTKKPTWLSKQNESLIDLNRKPDIQQTLVSETDNRARDGIQRHQGGCRVYRRVSLSTHMPILNALKCSTTDVVYGMSS